MSDMARYPHAYNNGMNITGVYLSDSYLRPVPQEDKHAWYYKSDQESMAGDFISPKGEPTSITLLNRYDIKLSSKCLSLPVD